MFEWALDTSKRYLDNWTENAILKKNSNKPMYDNWKACLKYIKFNSKNHFTDPIWICLETIIMR